nr:helix-turn-helix domain-containing protein [Kluyvera georgiana]
MARHFARALAIASIFTSSCIERVINLSSTSPLNTLTPISPRSRGRPGKRFGRPSALEEKQQIMVIIMIKAGLRFSTIAREFSTTRQSILRVVLNSNNSKCLAGWSARCQERTLLSSCSIDSRRTYVIFCPD